MKQNAEKFRAVYLSSSGSDTPGLEKMIKIWLAKVKPGAKVPLLSFNDANPGKKAFRDQDIYLKVKNIVQKLGFVPQGKAHKLFDLHKVDAIEMDHIIQDLAQPGVICIVVGGNTFRLASTFAQLPGLKASLKRHVNEGSAMYVSFSAGTVFAGKSVELARDDKRDVAKVGYRKDGLGLVKHCLRPHSQSETSKQAGKEFEKLVRQKKAKTDGGKTIVSKVKYIKDGQALAKIGTWMYYLPADIGKMCSPKAKAKIEGKTKKKGKAKAKAKGLWPKKKGKAKAKGFWLKKKVKVKAKAKAN